MTITTGEMTLAEMYRDPMILSVMRADGVALSEFKEMMAAAATSIKTRRESVSDVKFRATEAAAYARRLQVPSLQPLFASSLQQCCAHL
ncbi:hypothetical protein [uncultured Agrobacterium sp.]|uniref:hypothetical protein n=1 Tax=uncultured Agrobacterium sp. TaxID=157277 RepID=UPI0025EFD374|nr:hypothetical protein [uncultured Agrobacterium sp.]